MRARRVLVLAPHSDDEVFGCGGLLSQLAKGGSKVQVAIVSDGAGGVEGAPNGASGANPEETYRRARRSESERAAKILGPYTLEFLDFPDGQLRHCLEQLSSAFAERLAALEPDLVLVPSPLEATPDHRAVFRALHIAMLAERDAKTLRGLSDLEILTYEVNHPQYPDLLVDVTEAMGVLEAAIACFETQLERHNYQAAALGVRRYRVHSLPPSVLAAEGYCRLTADDLQTRSFEDLVAYLGGSPSRTTVDAGPPVSIIVRTYRRPDFLRQALSSLEANPYPNLEIVVVNDGGEPLDLARGRHQLTLVELPENRGRSAAANAGLEAASGGWVGFLDDDDLASPEHVATLVDAASAAGVQVVYSDAAVGVYELQGGETSDGRSDHGWVCVERRLPYRRDFDADLLLVDNYIPSNTLLIARELLDRLGGFDQSLPFFEDWDLWIRLAQVAPFHHLPRVTCEYRHFRGSSHHVLGGSADGGQEPSFLAMKAKVLKKHRRLLTPNRLGRVIIGLRRELVERAEEARLAREDAVGREQTQERYFELERHFHRLNGELVSLRGELGASRESAAEVRTEATRLFARERELLQELERVNQLLVTAVDENHHGGVERRKALAESERWRLQFDEEKAARIKAQERYFELEAHFHRLNGDTVALKQELEKQRAAAIESALLIQRLYDREAELGAQLASCHDEIKRLGQLIEAMEGTRAWRAHRFVERLRGGRG